MSRSYERYRERPRSPLRRWVTALTILVWIILIVLLLARFVARPALTRFVQDRIAQVSGQTGVTPELPDTILPSDIPAGSFTIRESDANQWLVEHRQELEGVEDVRLRFLPGEAQADVTIGGVSSTAHASVEVVDGKVVVTNPRLDWPLGAVVDVQPFAALIQERLNTDLATTGRTVTGATIESGQIVISIE
jgi:hypothetical protein